MTEENFLQLNDWIKWHKAESRLSANKSAADKILNYRILYPGEFYIVIAEAAAGSTDLFGSPDPYISMADELGLDPLQTLWLVFIPESPIKTGGIKGKPGAFFIAEIARQEDSFSWSYKELNYRLAQIMLDWDFH